jgi:type II secretion system (T2SS) protein M
VTPRDRRALIVGAAAVAGAVLLLRVVPWVVRGAGRLAARAEQQAATARRARSVLAAGPYVHDSLEEVLARIVNLAPVLVEGRSAAEAQASLAGLVSLAANRHALKVVRLDPLSDSSAGVFNRVTVHAELEGDIRGFAGIVGALETGQPLLTLSAFEASSPDPLTHPNTPEALHVALDITGYYLPRSAP